MDQLVNIDREMGIIHNELDIESKMELAHEEQNVEGNSSQPDVNMQPDMQPEMQPKNSRFVCDDCGYATNRKNNLTNHRNETCKVRRAHGLLLGSDTMCKICKKPMRHNALRAHIRHFINTLRSNKVIKGKHKDIRLDQFSKYLKEIKLEK